MAARQVTHVPNGGFHGIRLRLQAQAMGVLAGWPICRFVWQLRSWLGAWRRQLAASPLDRHSVFSELKAKPTRPSKGMQLVFPAMVPARRHSHPSAGR